MIQPSLTDPPSVLIIGGGIAGAACAIGLRGHGIDVDLVEKESFPRPKVCGCCIGGTGLAMLDRLGVRQDAVASGIATHRWCGSLGNHHIELDLPPGLAISREVLDPMLLARAIEQGARVTMQCSATIREATTSHVTLQVSTTSDAIASRYDIVVVAAGLRTGGVNEILPWKETPSGPFGVSLMASCDSIHEGVIAMVCDDDGYVGLVRLKDGRVDVAGALRSGANATGGLSPIARIHRMLAASRFSVSPLVDPTPVMTTPPLRRSRVAGNGRVIAIGDAAGYVEPFTGEGMTWAMQSGLAAADVIANRFTDPSAIGAAWQVEVNRLLKSKKRACRMVTNALRSPIARRAAAGTLKMFPGIAKPLIWSLNRSPQP